MNRLGRRRDRELSDDVDDPQPDRRAGKIAIRNQFLGSLSAFQLGRLAVMGDYGVGCAPDLDLRYHAGRLSGEPLSTVICPT
jgi:hypothetical protein